MPELCQSTFIQPPRRETLPGGFLRIGVIQASPGPVASPQDGQERVSRKQAFLYLKQGKLQVEDQQSANGTYVRASSDAVRSFALTSPLSTSK